MEGGCRGGGEGVKIKRSAIEFLIFYEEGGPKAGLEAVLMGVQLAPAAATVPAPATSSATAPRLHYI